MQDLNTPTLPPLTNSTHFSAFGDWPVAGFGSSLDSRTW